jgi:tRNA pseudouridine55 synthase
VFFPDFVRKLPTDKRREKMVDGVLIINKSSGMTSHDVVKSVRRLFGLQRVGHTGTLDPMATGVMVLLLGFATRLSQFMQHDDKHYQGTIRLGVKTTTYDADGEVVAVQPVGEEIDRIHQVVAGFQGKIAQIPPMYSALKINGQKLYKLARQGKTIRRQPRHVSIFHINVTAWRLPDFDIEVACSAGTYIRSLAHDIGETLGCGAHLRTLVRTASHGFTLAESHTLEEITSIAQEGDLHRVLLPPRAALGQMTALTLSPEQISAVRFGQKITLPVESQVPFIQALDTLDQLVAVMVPSNGGYWHPKVVLPVANSA